MKILWLASWYPDAYQGQNGDFVQRHAQAASQFLPIHLIHLAQAGHTISTVQHQELTQTENLLEMIHSFSYQPWGIAIIDKLRYNLLYLNQYKSILTQYIHQYGKPDCIHLHVAMKAGILALWAKHKWGIPYIISEHASLYDTNASDTFHKRSRYFQLQSKKIFKHASLVTNVSAHLGAVIQQLFKLPKVTVIHNVVNTQLFHPTPKAVQPIFRWVHVSNMSAQKNIEALLQSFQLLNATHSHWQLTIIGPILPQYKALAQQLGIASKIIFMGEMSNAEVATALQSADAFALSSTSENFPCVICEAHCCGIPVVATNVGGISEAIHPTNGILVPPQDTTAFSNALLQMMQNITHYHPIQIATTAQSRYSHATIGTAFHQLYTKMLIK